MQEDILSLASANQDTNNTIVLSNNNLQKLPSETSFFLNFLLDKLKRPNQTIKETFEGIRMKSYGNNSLNISLMLGNFPYALTWRGDYYNPTNSPKEDSNPPNSPGDLKLMPSFPFPPPKASAGYILDKEYFEYVPNLFEVSKILDNTLKACGYLERSYYKIPEGFALVTRIEKINLDASPCPIPERWNAPHSEDYDDFSIKDYFRSLFKAEVGKYRIIVFLVTSIPFSQTESQMSISDAEKYLKKGYNSLPIEFRLIRFTNDYDCTALIYEFDKIEYEQGTLIEYSKSLGYEHLVKNNFLPILSKRNR
jgi:hypothetical protein